MRRQLGLGLALAGLLAAPIASELRVTRPSQPLTDHWRTRPILPRGNTRLGISFRSPQIDAFNLEPRSTLRQLLSYPFELCRLGAYWNRIERACNTFDHSELDWQLEAAERAGKQVILCVGALKTFGYPEFFAPRHVVDALPESKRITAAAYASLLQSACDFIARVVDRYRHSKAIIAWQVEHEAVDPLGMEHSWRLDTSFVEREVQATRQADPSRPILLNGYLPMSLPVQLSQWWQMHDQGNSITVAQRLADIVGVDVYPRHALLAAGPWTAYLDATRSPWQFAQLSQVCAWAQRHRTRVMVTEGQSEPWEATTLPPNPRRHAAWSCPPERLIDNYNSCLSHARKHGCELDGYLFWGAEYWMVRQLAGDSSYLRAFGRIVNGG